MKVSTMNNRTTNKNQIIADSTKKMHFNLVPTGHPFKKVINYFLEFKKLKLSGDENNSSFVAWLIKEYKLKPSTAKAYCYPLGEKEFDLWGYSLEDLETLVQGGEPALRLTLNNRQLNMEERVLVCLNNARIVGVLNNQNLNPSQKVDVIIKKRYAGTKKTANLIRSVGKQVGMHFGLLDAKGNSTDLFDELFDDQ